MRASRLTLLFSATALAAGAVGAAPGTTAVTSPDLVKVHPTAHHLGTATVTPPTTDQCRAKYQLSCYGPAQFQQAYDLAPLFARGVDGRGQTIAIVDSFGSPTIQHDLDVFDQTYGLPATTVDIIQPAGPIPPYDPSSDMAGWAGETTLDVEWAHAMAPGAKLLLVETPTSETEGTAGFPEIQAAEKYVLDHHLASVISQSFAATEETFPSKESMLALRGAYEEAARTGVTVLTATGDAGATDAADTAGTLYTMPVTSWPASDPLITGVGGTKLDLDATGRRLAPDVVWNDTNDVPTNKAFAGSAGPNALGTGSGKSIFFPRPSYQGLVGGIVGDRRGVPDISMSGSCSGAVNVYQSFPGHAAGWSLSCGTSEATPLFAGIVALAAQQAGHPLGVINRALYQMSVAHAPGLVDVTAGDNTVTFTQDGKQVTVPGFKAGRGYDLASGVGTIDAARFVPELAALAGHGY